MTLTATPRTAFPRLTFLRPALLLALLLACGGTGDGTGTDTGDDTTASETGEPTTGGSGEMDDLNEYELGASASALCKAAAPLVAELTQAADAGDASAASTAYTGTDLQMFVQRLDGSNERSDDAAIVAALADASPAELGAAAARVHVALALELRAQMAAVEEGAEDKYAAWDEAHCVWQAGLRALAEEADAVTWHSVDETVAADVDAALQAAHDGLSGEAPVTNADEWRVPPHKQIAEKSLHRAFHRVIVELAGEGDALAARRALELFGAIEDRLDGRNTPGIQQVKDILAGDPAMIDADAVLTELDLAFAKRTRRYADAAIADGELGTPSGYEGAVEGNTYAKLVLPGMLAAVADADPAAFLGEWAGYAELVRDGTDTEGLAGASQRLIDQICAYQTALGIAACTGDADETE